MTHVYSRKPGVLSFIGFVPSNAPRLAILALLDEPKTVVWGSEAAAPIFAAVASQVLRHLDIAPTGDVPPLQIVRGPATPPALILAGGATERDPGDLVDRDPRDPETALMPDLVGRSLRQALALLAVHQVDISVQGRGVVVRQTPVPGTPLSPGAFCRLELVPPAEARIP